MIEEGNELKQEVEQKSHIQIDGMHMAVCPCVYACMCAHIARAEKL